MPSYGFESAIHDRKCASTTDMTEQPSTWVGSVKPTLKQCSLPSAREEGGGTVGHGYLRPSLPLSQLSTVGEEQDSTEGMAWRSISAREHPESSLGVSYQATKVDQATRLTEIQGRSKSCAYAKSSPQWPKYCCSRLCCLSSTCRIASQSD